MANRWLTCAVLLLLGSPGARAAGRADAKRLYEQKCLYCHSGSVIEQLRLRPSQWRRVVGRMRAHAPLLIGAQEGELIARYLVTDLKLVPRDFSPSPPVEKKARPAPPVVLPVSEGPPFGPAPRQPEPAPTPPPPPPPVQEEVLAETVPEPEDAEAEEVGPRLIADKCSKCHTIRRVFTKIDSQEVGDAVIERMRRRTGSGITPDDAEMLHRFLRSRMSRDQVDQRQQRNPM